MDKEKFSKKIKEGVSIRELETFFKRHTMPIFSILAIFVAMISSIFHFFSGPGLAAFFLGVGTMISIIWPAPIERGLRMIFLFIAKQEKVVQIILGGLKIIIGLFVPFIYFGFLGLLAGTSYHYYIRHHLTETTKSR